MLPYDDGMMPPDTGEKIADGGWSSPRGERRLEREARGVRVSTGIS
jgi:hypothetical protein